MAKSPSFQFYPTDFLSDKNVILMSAEEVGAYIRLLCVCWIESDLSEDIGELALIAKVAKKRFEQIWEKRIKICFRYDEKKKRFFHKRLRKEIQKQKEFRKKKSEAGKESGRKRREKKELDAEQVFDSVQTKGEQKRTLHSSSSSSSSSPKKEDNSNELSKPQSARGNGIPVNPNSLEEVFSRTVADGLCSRLNLVSLPNHANWVEPIAWAFKNNFTAEQVLECYDLLKSQDWRTGAINGRTLVDNLPNLEKLRNDTNPNKTDSRESLDDTLREIGIHGGV